MEDLAKATGEAAQLQTREKLRQEGRHQGDTEAYKRAFSAESHDLAKFITRQYAKEIPAVLRHIGLLLRKSKTMTVVEMEKGYLMTGPLELGLAVPLTAQAEIVLKATPPAISLTPAQKTLLDAGKEVNLPVALEKEMPVVLKAREPIRMEGINFIPPSSDFCVKPPGALALLLLFEVQHLEGNEVGN